MAQTSEFSIPEFLRSDEFYTELGESDLSEDFQNAALPIYEEMEKIMLQHGKESVENLLPLIVQVFIHKLIFYVFFILFKVVVSKFLEFF